MLQHLASPCRRAEHVARCERLSRIEFWCNRALEWNYLLEEVGGEHPYR
jgi:hypothetical protein